MMACSCALIFKFFSAPPDGATIEYEISSRGFSGHVLLCFSELRVYVGKCVLLW